MRGFLVLLAPAGLVGAGGRYTRPEQAPAAWAFDNFRVATRSTMTSNDRDLLECRGFFTRFLCTGAPPQADVAISG